MLSNPTFTACVVVAVLLIFAFTYVACVFIVHHAVHGDTSLSTERKKKLILLAPVTILFWLAEEWQRQLNKRRDDE